MATLAGKRYVGPSGAEVIVTKGGDGELSDGEVGLRLKENAGDFGAAVERTQPLLAIGKRYRSADNAVELLVIKAGVCDLRYNGEPMQQLAAKILPSAD